MPAIEKGGRRGKHAPLAGRRWFAGGLAASALLLAACAQTPESFVAAFDAALASGDVARVEAHLTPPSRAVFRAMLATAKGPAPDPTTGIETEAGDRPFAPRRPEVPTRVLAVRPQRDGSLILRVAAGEREREWVARPAAGVLQLDLLATSSRATREDEGMEPATSEPSSAPRPAE